MPVRVEFAEVVALFAKLNISIASAELFHQETVVFLPRKFVMELLLLSCQYHVRISSDIRENTFKQSETKLLVYTTLNKNRE